MRQSIPSSKLEHCQLNGMLRLQVVHQESNALPETRRAEPKGKESDLGQVDKTGEKAKRGATSAPLKSEETSSIPSTRTTPT
jgi:hypothetical protein